MGGQKPLNILYLSYDGMTDPLGRSQVLAYLEKLSSSEFAFSLISYEKEDQFRLHRPQIDEICNKRNIDWYPLPYTKSPPIVSTIYDLWQGWRLLKRLDKEKNIDILHCRGYITAILGLRGRHRINAKFIFDMRGFWADEKRESGNWGSWIYRPIYGYFKKLEETFFEESDAVISLTNHGKKYIVEHGWSENSKVKVIPTCVNFDLFPPSNTSVRMNKRKELGIKTEEVVFIYSGSLGGNYPIHQLLDIFTKCHQAKQQSAAIILSNSPHQMVYCDPAYQNYPFQDRLTIKSAPIEEVHHYLMASDYGVIFYREGFSNIGRCPTKLGEYWACGVNVIVESGFRKMVHLPSIITDLELAEQVEVSTDHNHLRQLAQQHFSIEIGVMGYVQVYEELGLGSN